MTVKTANTTSSTLMSLTMDTCKGTTEKLLTAESNSELMLTGNVKVDTLIPRTVKTPLTLTKPDSRTYTLKAIFSTRPITAIWLLQPKRRLMRITLDMITLIKQRVAKLLTISSIP